jgi:hypothetical protein
MVTSRPTPAPPLPASRIASSRAPSPACRPGRWRASSPPSPSCPRSFGPGPRALPGTPGTALLKARPPRRLLEPSPLPRPRDEGIGPLEVIPRGYLPVFGVRSSRNTSPRTAAPILRPASSANSASVSAPTKKRPSSFAATPVVPDPQNGSKTRSPSPVEARTARRTRRRGFWVGWRPWDFSLMGTAGRRQTEETWEEGSGLLMRS